MRADFAATRARIAALDPEADRLAAYRKAAGIDPEADALAARVDALESAPAPAVRRAPRTLLVAGLAILPLALAAADALCGLLFGGR